MVKHKVLLDNWRSHSWTLLLVMGSCPSIIYLYLHTASDQMLEVGTAWERVYLCFILKLPQTQVPMALTRSTEIARFHSEEFEKTFVALVLARKVMFHLNCFEYFCASGDHPSSDINSKQSSVDLLIAKNCLVW